MTVVASRQNRVKRAEKKVDCIKCSKWFPKVALKRKKEVDKKMKGDVMPFVMCNDVKEIAKLPPNRGEVRYGRSGGAHSLTPIY